jgi:DNA-directed RNA polymerase subunit H (RpoH/RPB5)
MEITKMNSRLNSNLSNIFMKGLHRTMAGMSDNGKKSINLASSIKVIDKEEEAASTFKRALKSKMFTLPKPKNDDSVATSYKKDYGPISEK